MVPNKLLTSGHHLYLIEEFWEEGNGRLWGNMGLLVWPLPKIRCLFNVPSVDAFSCQVSLRLVHWLGVKEWTDIHTDIF